MATQTQANLQKKNAEYASSFKDGHLALPPAKKYAVGKSHQVSKPFRSQTPDIWLFQSPAWTRESTQQQPMA